MKVYIVVFDHKYEGFQSIYKVFSEKKNAEDFIKEYLKNDPIKADRGDELRTIRNDNYFDKLKEQGIYVGTPEAINYPYEKAVEIDQAFEESLIEYDRECLNYFRLSGSETLNIIEMELE